MPNHKPFQVGLTGGLGSGKSTVARIFQVLGVPVYESDFWAKSLYFHPDVKKEVLKLMGSQAYLSENQIHSKWIANQVYGNQELREKLNAILHPAVGHHYRTWLTQQVHPYVLKVAALVFEANIHLEMDMNLLVTSPIDMKKIRIKKRDPQREESQIESIMASQWSDEAKRKLADGEIFNDEKQSLMVQVLRWNQFILSKL